MRKRFTSPIIGLALLGSLSTALVAPDRAVAWTGDLPACSPDVAVNSDNLAWAKLQEPAFDYYAEGKSTLVYRYNAAGYGDTIVIVQSGRIDVLQDGDGNRRFHVYAPSYRLTYTEDYPDRSPDRNIVKNSTSYDENAPCVGATKNIQYGVNYDGMIYTDNLAPPSGPHAGVFQPIFDFATSVMSSISSTATAAYTVTTEFAYNTLKIPYDNAVSKITWLVLPYDFFKSLATQMIANVDDDNQCTAIAGYTGGGGPIYPEIMNQPIQLNICYMREVNPAVWASMQLFLQAGLTLMLVLVLRNKFQRTFE